MDFGDHDLGARSILLQLGNDDVCVYRKFGLRIPSQQSSYEDDGTHVEDLKNPVEVRLPGCDLLFVILCVEVLRNRASFALLDDLHLYFRHGSETRPKMSPTSCPKCTVLAQLTQSTA